MLAINFSDINKIGFNTTLGHYAVLDNDPTRYPIAEADYRQISSWADGGEVADATLYMAMTADTFADFAEFSMSTGWAG